MAENTINVGYSPSDGTGDPLRTAFIKINENFDELYNGNVNVIAANVLVHSVAGRTGNVVLTTNDVVNAASIGYVNSAIAANVNNYLGATLDSINSNLSLLNSSVSDHEGRITVLEGDASAASAAITSLQNNKADISYVDSHIDAAVNASIVSINFDAMNANITAANAQIALKANLGGQVFTGNITAPNIIVTSNVEIDKTLFVGDKSVTDYPGLAASFIGNVPSYYQMVIQNKDSGPQSSGDIVITADDGDDVTNYLNITVNSSNWSGNFIGTFGDTGLQQFPHDGYFAMIGGNAAIASDNATFIVANTAVVALQKDGPLQLVNTFMVYQDGTAQDTAYPGPLPLIGVHNEVVAANLQIDNLYAVTNQQQLDIDFLMTNAGIQHDAIESLNDNVYVANQNINTLLANAVVQGSDINDLFTITSDLRANDVVHASTLNSLQSNAASQAVSINLINANVTAANLVFSSLTANAGTQATQINTINANVVAANVVLQGVQSDVAFILNTYQPQINATNANVSAANINIQRIDANLGLTTGNVNTLFSLMALGNAAFAADSIAINNRANISGQVFTGNVETPYLITSANVISNGILEVGTTNNVDYPGKAAIFTGDVDSYYQLVLQNKNSGINASGDIVITADDGDDGSNYINLGINGSNFAGAFNTVQAFPHDGYVSVVGGNVAILSTANVVLIANTSIVQLRDTGNFALINADLEFKNGSVQHIAYDPLDIPFTPFTPSDWDGTITTMTQALNELASRLRASGH